MNGLNVGACSVASGLFTWDETPSVMKVCDGSNWFKLSTAVRIFLIAGSTWTVPADWKNTDNRIELIGGGGGGASTGAAWDPVGGGGGAYVRLTDVALTPGSVVSIRVGSPGSAGAAARGGTEVTPGLVGRLARRRPWVAQKVESEVRLQAISYQGRAAPQGPPSRHRVQLSIPEAWEAVL